MNKIEKINILETKESDSIDIKMQEQQANNNLNGASNPSQTGTTNFEEGNGHAITDENNSTNGNTDNGTNNFITPNPKINLDKTNRDIVRLIGQHLKIVGLNNTAELLMQESGCSLEHSSASKFRQHVLSGDWNKADHYLQELQPMVEDKTSNIVEMKFLLLEQKYLEFLESSRPLDALHVLRNELTPLNHNTPRVHQLSSYMMCATNADLYKRANWEGEGIKSRTILMDKLQSYLPASVMLPPQRLKLLLTQAVEMQTDKCACHDMAWKTDIENVSLLVDHNCSQDAFPMTCLQILNDHCDEVMICKFSPDGLKLATGSKDTTVIIWEIDPQELTVRYRKTLDGHTYGVSFVTWSPDSKFLLVGGTEECPELWIWNIEEEKLHVKVSHSTDDSFTCAAFSPDGKKFVTGGLRGQFYLCDLDGTIQDSWDGIRVHALAFRSDNKTVLAADTHHRIRAYVFDSPRMDYNVLQEHTSIMTFSINTADRYALLNMAGQGVHLWDLQNKCLVRRFNGTTQGTYTIYSCFGGVSESFIASGSEDNKVIIWHIKREEPLATLTGHTRTVNCVSWNPVYPALLASASDDGTVRIWGPKRIPNLDNDDVSNIETESSTSWNMTT